MYALSALVVSVLLLNYSNQYITNYQPNLEPVVPTKQGLVQGGTSYSRLGRPFHYFKGIPFATPPIGKLRFKAPLPASPWEGIRSAKEHGSVCVARNELFEPNSKTRGSEDCLFINVYTPELPSVTKLTDLKPVMVWIFYGGLFSGDSNSDLYGPEYLMDKDVVLVSFNYRLGVFGLLSTGDDASPGNFGFKDQVLALKWVQENIVNFGGDNEKVTIFGQSAGGASVHHHVLSPSSKGLFHAAISQSGSAFNLWASPINGSVLLEISTKEQAKVVGCPTNVTTHEIVDCLRDVDAYDLADSIDKLRFFQIEPLNPFFPAIEVKSELNPEPFITQMPLEIINEETYNKVPYIIGTVQDEGILRSSPLTRNSSVKNELNEHFNEYMPMILGLMVSVSPDRVPETYNKIVEYFLGSPGINTSDPKSVQGLTDLFSDRVFVYGSYQGALEHARNGHQPLWYYSFNYKGAQTNGDKFALVPDDINFNWGTAHCDDLIYIFNSPRLFEPLTGTDCTMIEIMTDMWTNFATHFNPTPDSVVVEGLTWLPTKDITGQCSASNSDLLYLNISGSYGGDITFSMENEYYPSRMSFWASLDLIESIPQVV